MLRNIKEREIRNRSRIFFLQIESQDVVDFHTIGISATISVLVQTAMAPVGFTVYYFETSGYSGLTWLE
jgi:hypothetical protein